MVEEVACLVCADSTPPLYRVCNCNTLLHEKCFEGVVASVPSHASGCPVCLRQYRTVRTDHMKRSRLASVLLLAVSAFTWYAAILTKISFFMFISVFDLVDECSTSCCCRDMSCLPCGLQGSLWHLLQVQSRHATLRE